MSNKVREELRHYRGGRRDGKTASDLYMALGFIFYFPHLFISVRRFQKGSKDPFRFVGLGFLRFVLVLDSDDLPERNREFVTLAKRKLLMA